MLIQSDNLINLPIASVQSEHRIGQIQGVILDPKNFAVAAFEVSNRTNPSASILHVSDITQASLMGILIQHNDLIMPDEDLVRLDEIRKENFTLIGLKVETEDGTKLGIINSYTVDLSSFLIEKIIVRGTGINNIIKTEKIVSRNQIVKITRKKVVVKSTKTRDEQLSPSAILERFNIKPMPVTEAQPAKID